jgi:hypothetical protein
VLSAAASAGYRRTFTLAPAPVDGELKSGLVGRFPMSPDVWRIEFSLTCAGAYGWLGFVRRVVRNVRTAARTCVMEETSTT